MNRKINLGPVIEFGPKMDLGLLFKYIKAAVFSRPGVIMSVQTSLKYNILLSFEGTPRKNLSCIPGVPAIMHRVFKKGWPFYAKITKCIMFTVE